MTDLVLLDFAEAGAGCTALPFGIDFPTLADACAWLHGQGYAAQSSDFTQWARVEAQAETPVAREAKRPLLRRVA